MKKLIIALVVIIVLLIAMLIFCWTKKPNSGDGLVKHDTIYIGNEMTMCNTDSLPTAADTLNGIPVKQNEYNQWTNDYRIANPGRTWGGRIGKWQIMAVLRSLADEQNFVNFRFFKEPVTGKTGVIFSGGVNTPPHTPWPDGGPVRYRNAGYLGYCPYNCN
jgi:hypothetical protein